MKMKFSQIKPIQEKFQTKYNQNLQLFFIETATNKILFES